MKFNIPKPKEQILATARRVGYIPQRSAGFDEHVFVRPLARGGYPRFHLYVKDHGEEWAFSLHLDQRQPTYGRHTAHSGEYDGELVEAETERIKAILLVR